MLQGSWGVGTHIQGWTSSRICAKQNYKKFYCGRVIIDGIDKLR